MSRLHSSFVAFGLFLFVGEICLAGSGIGAEPVVPVAGGGAPLSGMETADIGTLARIDEQFAGAMAENYRVEGRSLMADNLAACERALLAAPSDYDLLWRAARSAMELVDAAQIQESKDWKELCGSLLPKALSRTETAIGAEPERVEAYFWQLQVISLVYDAQGLAPFIAEGLAAKSRRDIEKSSAIDPGYLDYSVLLAQAMYYYRLPSFWGRDLDKAFALYREFEARTTWSFEPYRQYIQAATLLIGTKKPENIAHARELLLRSLQDPTPRSHYRGLSEKLLAEANALLAGN